MTNTELYERAKEAYYNGEPIMSDLEFDELERSLGLENKAYVGTKHNPSYTEHHPYIMGSLSKVQVKATEDGSVDWGKYFADVCGYVSRNVQSPKVIVSPKYDGCSFEVVVRNHSIVSISTRGDGEYGRDIKQHIERKIDSTHTQYDGEYTLRGEVLVRKDIFLEKYSDFVNPRSFVSGVLNRDIADADTEFDAMLDDLSIVIYDVRFNTADGYMDHDFTEYEMNCLPEYFKITEIDSKDTLKSIYHEFADYREKCEFALDGIVLKPVAEFRSNNTTEARPKDCVAVKFIPMLEETVVEEIMWNTRKTNELRPVIRVAAVTMDGKKITRASAHNYGFLIENKISVGTKLILSLAGDIIPFIYKVTNTDAFDESNMCLPSDIETYVDGVHLYKKMSVEEINEKKFIASTGALNIPTIGEAAAKAIYEHMCVECSGDEFFDIAPRETPNNILMVLPEDADRALGGKLGSNARKAMIDVLKKITIKDIIVSCTFPGCGNRVAEEIEKHMLFGNGDFEHLAAKAYQWALNKNSDEYKQVMSIMNFIGKNIDDFKVMSETAVKSNANAIPVILTGEPKTYPTKAHFLKAHPEYKMTTSWKEVKIVFTNSMESTTGKMKKAIEKGIEIKLY